MFNAARIRADFNAAAAHYDAHASLQNNVLRKLVAACGSFAPHSTILDAGCGTGAFGHLLADNHTCGSGNPDLRIIALDNAHAMCLQANHSGNLPVNADMAKLPFTDNSFDVVFSSLALQWASDWKIAINEWLRVLKPGGMLAFSTFGAGTLSELAASFRYIDSHAHVSSFISPNEMERHIAATFTHETITEYYPDVATLARHLKALGARNKDAKKRAGLMTPRQFKCLEKHYAENYGTEKGLQVSWNIIYGTIRKP